MIGRRAFLAGGAALLAGCAGAGPFGGRGSASPALAGEVRLEGARRGHLLRGGGIPAPSRRVRTGVAVIGAGAAGLSAAWRLLRGGVEDLLVLDLEDRPGGNACFEEYPESAAPWGAHYLPVPTADSRAVLALLEEMGLVAGWGPDGRPRWDERHLCHAPEERLFCFGRWIEGLYPRTGASREDLRQLRGFEEEIARHRASGAFRIPIDRSPEAARGLDALSMEAWLDGHGWTSARLRWFVEYGCRDDYGTDLASTSAWAGLHYFSSREEEGALFTWPEGNGRLIAHLAGAVGPRRIQGALAWRIAASPRGVEVDYLDLERGESVRVEAGRAVVAVPAFLWPRLIEGAFDLSGFTYAPWAVANLALDGPPREPPGSGLGLAWDNVFYGSPSLGYVHANHQDLRTAPGPTVLTWYRPMLGEPAAQRQALLRRPWASWVAEILGELEAAHPGVSASVRRVDVRPVGHAMVRPVPGLLWGGRRARLARPRGRIHFAHSDLSGFSIFEEAQAHGVRAAEEILAALGLPGGSLL